VELFGKPDQTADLGLSESWSYKELTKDAVTDKVDTTTSLVFKDRRVREALFLQF
jgi:hypothetical protein